MASLPRRRVVVNTLRILWVLVMLWYEFGTFYSSVQDCNWPDLVLLPDSVATNNETTAAHVLLVADPQIVDRYSYSSRNIFFAYLTRLIVDLNLRKNWQAAIKKKPDVIVFLGDMMDNGRDDMSDSEYEEYYQRFRNIFRTEEPIPQYFIPGNHDIGLGKTTFSPIAHSRYVSHFGHPNSELSIANHTLVLFDAPGYADEVAKRYFQKQSINQWNPRRGGSFEYVKKFSKEEHVDPVILFSHIPLYRSDGKPCGALREKGTIRPGAGPGYQNILEKQSSQRLLEVFKPVVIFSGDDHDYCEYTHRVSLEPKGPLRDIREITVKTISMVMNVRRPGFQLLSLAPVEIRNEASPTYVDRPCSLPDQLRIYINIYLPLLAMSLLVVFLASLKHRPSLHSKTSSNTGEVMFLADIEEGDEDDIESSPYVSSRSRGSPSAAFSGQRGKFASRAPAIRPGWFVSQGEHRQPQVDQTFYSCCSGITDILFSVTSSSARSTAHRRSWLGVVLRDVRDIAIFPLVTFLFITWWVVMK